MPLDYFIPELDPVDTVIGVRPDRGSDAGEVLARIP
jgi:hypothetical protein